MGWTYEQQARLQRELDILSQYFPAFSYVNHNGVICLEGWMKTNGGTNYKLRLYVPPDIPYSVPDVVIISPYPVTDYWGRSLVSMGPSADMHLLEPRDSCPKICTYKSTNWNSNVTFYKVLIKVRMWIEALEGHKRTGNKLDLYLTHQI